jgi:hypothetical protein
MICVCCYDNLFKIKNISFFIFILRKSGQLSGVKFENKHDAQYYHYILIYPFLIP